MGRPGGKADCTSPRRVEEGPSSTAAETELSIRVRTTSVKRTWLHMCELQ